MSLDIRSEAGSDRGPKAEGRWRRRLARWGAAGGRGSWLRASWPSRRRGTPGGTACCSTGSASCSPATTWPGTGTARRLTAFKDYCWYSWPQQAGSMARLAAYRFEWVLPGHGQRVRLPADEMRRQVERLAESMREGHSE